MEYVMGHSVSRTAVVSECSPPPMCGLGRSEGFGRIAPLVIGGSDWIGLVDQLQLQLCGYMIKLSCQSS